VALAPRLRLAIRIEASLSCILAMPWSEIRRVSDRPLLDRDLRDDATDADPAAEDGGCWDWPSCAECRGLRRDDEASDEGAVRPLDLSCWGRRPRDTSCRLEWNDCALCLSDGSRSRDCRPVKLELRPEFITGVISEPVELVRRSELRNSLVLRRSNEFVAILPCCGPWCPS